MVATNLLTDALTRLTFCFPRNPLNHSSSFLSPTIRDFIFVHILHVIGSLDPADGGPPEAVRQFVQAHPLVGDTAEAVCVDRPGASFLSNWPCPVHALGPAALGRFGLSPRLWEWLGINASRFDGIVMNGVWTFPPLAVRAMARRSGVPYAVFPHGSLDPWFQQAYPLKHGKKLLYWPLQYPVFRDAAAVCFTCSMEADLARTSFSPHTWRDAVIPLATSGPAGDAASDIAAFYDAVPTVRDRRFFLFLARFHEKKGCDLLIEAFARVAASAPDVDLVMAGPDQMSWQAQLRRMAWEAGIADRVHWPGQLAGSVKWGALRAAEAFVLASHSENFGIAVIESLAAGRPVLITNKVNIWPEIQSNGVGIVEDDTVDGTERLLRGWLGMPAAEQAAMATRAQPFVMRQYSAESIASSIHQLFKNTGGRSMQSSGGSKPAKVA
jgi:glycosyltransferase involved in cell wall biosynthesis